MKRRICFLWILGLSWFPLGAKAELKESKPTEVSITLKDGQSAEAVVLTFDDYFLEVETVEGIKVDIPWREIGAIVEKETSGASAFFAAKMMDGDSRVETLLAPLAPSKARNQALLAGFFVHGWGHRYARDRATFLSLVGAQAFGLLVAGIGGNDFLDPTFKKDDRRISAAMVVTGLTFFVGSWFWDIAFAPGAVKKFNKLKGLTLTDQNGQVMLGMNVEF